MRNDSFLDIEAFRLAPPPATVRKAVRLWTGGMKFAVSSEESARAVADCIKASVANSAAWEAMDVASSDNIVIVTGMRYQARSANANDAEQLAVRCIINCSAALISPIAVQTSDSVKLTSGR